MSAAQNHRRRKSSDAFITLHSILAAVVFGSTGMSATPVAALDFPISTAALDSADPVLVFVFFIVGVVFACMAIALYRMRAGYRRVVDRAADLEARLDEAGTILTAEPHLLYIWRGKEQLPSQIAGDLRAMKDVPRDYAGRVAFSSWLDGEAADRLTERLNELRTTGLAFNIVVRTMADELLEADGRAAGGLATLRLRMLTGERMEMAKVTEDHRVLERQSQALNAILDSAPLPIWTRDADGRMNWANEAFLEAVEVEDSNVALATGVELVDAEQRANALACVATGEIHRQRAQTVIGGERRALDIVDMPTADGSAGFALDVTELDSARSELERHIQAHTSTLDKLATAVAIFGADRRLRFFNAAYCELWQLDPEWLGEKPSDGEVLDQLRADRRLPEQADYRAWKARRMDAYTNLDTHEDWWHLPDGRSLRVITEQHPFGGVTYLFEDVTERLNLESRYNALIGVQRETLDNLHEGVALFGSDGRLKLFNQAYAKIWQLDVTRLAEEPHIDEVIDACRGLFDDDVAWDELKIGVTSLDEGRRPLNSRLTQSGDNVIDFSSVPLPDGAMLLTYVDVTDSSNIERALRDRNDALETADRLKTEFISHVSYELRTPLTNIIGFTESMTMGIAGELTPRQSEYTGHILSSSQTLLAIIDDILDLATIDAGVMELDLAEVDVAETLKSAAQLIQDRVRARGLVLEIELGRDVATLTADARRIKQILYNLLSNAVGFSAPGDTIRMGASRDDGNVYIWVSDNGPGIEPERQAAVFERFETRTVGSEHRGAGLGLSVVKSFVELHGGVISLKSKPEEGTTIVCKFPPEGPEWLQAGDGQHTAVAGPKDGSTIDAAVSQEPNDLSIVGARRA